MPIASSAMVAASTRAAARAFSASSTRSPSAVSVSWMKAASAPAFFVANCLRTSFFSVSSRARQSCQCAARAGMSRASQSPMPAPRAWSFALPDRRSAAPARATSVASKSQAARSTASSLAAPGGRPSARASAGSNPARPWRFATASISRPRVAASVPRVSAKRAGGVRRASCASAPRSGAPPSTASRSRASMARASRSSTTANCGASPASRGKARSRDCAKAWMVEIRIPPGCSSTRTNRARAARSSSGPGARPVRRARAAVRSAGSAVAQAPSARARRVAISAAAALVKVRQRMRPGSTPASSRRSTRSVSSLVLPDPAEASTQAEAAGSEARDWACSARSRGVWVIGAASYRAGRVARMTADGIKISL